MPSEQAIGRGADAGRRWKNPGMSAVARLVTVVDIDGLVVDRTGVGSQRVGGGPAVGADTGPAPLMSGNRVDAPAGMSFSALHLAVLRDGRRVVLLNDRGWSVSGPPDTWQGASAAGIEGDARAVVGPDEPFGSHSQADMASDHWAHLAGILRNHGIQIEPGELSRLHHDVELSERLRSRIAGD